MKDICIIGGGITGLSTAYFLKQYGILSVEVRSRQLFKNVLGLAVASHRDNITRLAVAHGDDFAFDFLNFLTTGQQEIIKFCTVHNIPTYTGNKIRWAQKEFEKVEIKKAQILYENAGKNLLLEKHEESLLQIEPHSVTYLNYQSLIEALHSTLQANIVTTGVSPQNLNLFEIIVCANHFKVPEILPKFHNCFITAQDQWWSYEKPPHLELKAFEFHAFENGHDWLYSTDSKIFMGGGRYMRKWAGFEAVKPYYDTIIENKIRKKNTDILKIKNSETWTIIDQVAFLDCFPCDELPVVGPNFGDPKYLIASGFLGCGIAPAFLAGKCIAELIAFGKSEHLPRRFFPERLRSL